MRDIVGLLAATLIFVVLAYNLVFSFANEEWLNTVFHGASLIVGVLLLASYFGFTQAVPVAVDPLLSALTLLLAPLFVVEHLTERGSPYRQPTVRVEAVCGVLAVSVQ
ncbi:hypothetical protein C440_08767 [Haloferax mucosum ATCC BAA-1512]|uniref:Uncharacterized protein n=1 Tax=Haloferax mucosum ATCC BAA-1512 TaxID=662479 RepID=M0IEH1_9EURY|nr:hypothetical protein [Haloferax mucosum]ELZ95156.1 hypothetical protein C440_08767 [Haloferax mucosum ATCC BAA-1512]